MSQAEALLDSIPNGSMSTYLVDSDNEPHIVIGDNRRITVPESLKRIAVQYDHDVETVTFDCPRYWDNLDMSKMAIYINYMRSDGYGDSYPARDVTEDGDIMHFTWTISANVTEVAGPLSFLVCIKNVDDEGTEVNHWNSEICQDMRVSEGMETEEQAIDMYPDLVTQLLLRMDSVEKVNVTKEYIDSRVSEAETAAETTAESAAEIRNSYCNAVKKTVTGEIVTMNDVSPLEHDVECKVHGKNLILYPYVDTTKTTNGITFTDNGDGSITINGTATADAYFFLQKNIEYGGIINAITTDSANNGIYTASKRIYYNATTKTLTVNIPSETVLTNETIYPQVEFGLIATEYEPYIDPTTVTVTGCGKNLFNKAAVTSDYMLVEDGTVTKVENNGVHVSDFIRVMAGMIYYCTSTSSHRAKFYDANKQPLTADSFDMNGISGGCYFTIPDGVAYIRFTVYDVVIDSVQLEFGSEATDYEPYIGSTVVPTSDGTCMVKSVSPIMTIFTDTPGVTIEAEYSRDQHKVLGDLQTALDTIISMQNSILAGDE